MSGAELKAQERLERVLYLAEHLWQMIPQELWRDTGGYDEQGHYEGDYRAEQVRDELVAHSAALSTCVVLTAEEAERVERLIARLNAGPLTTEAWKDEQLSLRFLLRGKPLAAEQSASYVALLSPDEAGDE